MVATLATLAQVDLDALDGGPGRPSPLGLLAAKVPLGTLLTEISERLSALDGGSSGGVEADSIQAQTANGTIAVSSPIASTKAVSTTAGVASGDTRKIGGLVKAIVAASTGITNHNTEQFFDAKYTIPANTIVAGTKIRARFVFIASATHSTDTFLFTLYLGSTAICVSAAIDLADGDACVADVEITGRAAAGAAAACALSGCGVNKTTAFSGASVANQATNAALDLKASVTMSAADAGNVVAIQQLDVSIEG